MTIALRLLIAGLPLLLALLFAFLVTAPLSFGSGEKDILLALPLLLWSLVYLVCFLVLWVRHRPLWRSCAVASGVATGVVFVLWLTVLIVTLAS
jgi:hypothetical protein